MPLPTCTVNGLSTSGGVDVADDLGTVTIQLTDLSARTWSISVTGTDDVVVSPTLTINQTTKTATFTKPAGPWALIFTSVVDGGVDVNGATQQSYTTTFGVYCKTANKSLRLTASNERGEGSATFGWIKQINAAIRAVESASGGVGGSAAARPTNTSSFAPLSIAHPEWAIKSPSASFKVAKNDLDDNAPYADSDLANPYSDADANGARTYRVCAPPGATGIVVNAYWKLPQGVVSSTPALALYDTTPTQLAAQAYALTSSYAVSSLSHAVAAGSEYDVYVAMNNATLGTSVQAQAEIAYIEVLFTGATGVFASSFQRIACPPDAMVGNTQGWDLTVRGHRHSAQSRLIVPTNASSIVFEAWCNNATNVAQRSIEVKVNGRTIGTYDPIKTDGTLYYQAVDLSNFPGEKTVEIVEASAMGTSLPIEGTFLRAVYVPSASATRAPITQVGGKKLLICGDSTSQDYFTNATQRGWARRLRTIYPGLVQLDGWGGRMLSQDVTSQAGATALAQKLAYSKADEFIIGPLLTNDWGNNSQTAANAAVNMGYLVDALHTAAPAAKVWLLDPFIRQSEEIANANGDTLADFRSANGVVCSSRSWLNRIYGASILALADLTDGIHPGDSGHDKVFRFIASALGLLPTSAILAFKPTSMANLVDYWEADTGIALDGSSKVQTWTGAANAKALTQATAGNRPPVVAAGLGGRQTISFGGTSQCLPGAFTLSEPYTLTLVLKMSALGASGVSDIICDGFTSTSTLVGTDNTPSTTVYDGLSLTDTQALSTTDWSIVTVCFDTIGRLDVRKVDYGTVTRLRQVTHNLNNNVNAGGLTIGALGNATRGAQFQIAGAYLRTGNQSAAEENTLVESFIKPTWKM